MIIAVASGKGGTGKTTVSTNLAKICGADWHLLDCDVEEPNVHLFLPGEKIYEERFSVLIPQVNKELCNACGECSRFCEFNAIVSFGTVPLIFADMCHSCGGCLEVCPQQAICEIDRPIGTISTIKGEVIFTEGRLDVGMVLSSSLIGAIKTHVATNNKVLIDAPPGTSCPVVAALEGVDFVILVTEPTPFGLHDLKLAVAMVQELGIPCGVFINRSDSGDERVHQYCQGEKIEILAELPNDRRIAEAYSNGILLIDVLPEYRALFSAVLHKIEQKLQQAHRGLLHHSVLSEI